MGPRDIKPTATGRIILDAISGRIPAYVDTGLNVVHVNDVAEGHRLALERGEIGERYILGGKNMSLREILNELAAIAGHTPPRFRMPHSAAALVVCISETCSKISGGGEPRVTRDGVKMAGKHMFFFFRKGQRRPRLPSPPCERRFVGGGGLVSAERILRVRPWSQ